MTGVVTECGGWAGAIAAAMVAGWVWVVCFKLRDNNKDAKAQR